MGELGYLSHRLSGPYVRAKESPSKTGGSQLRRVMVDGWRR